MKTFQIGNRDVGADAPVFIVAELSCNHNKRLDIAVKTIRAAKESGADAIKFQTYTPDTLTIDCDNEYFRINHGTLWDNKTLYQLYEEAYMPWEWHGPLFEEAKNVGLISFSSPFDRSAVDLLESFAVPAYKIASFEITDIPLIEYAASKGRPVILSTGVASLGDIDLAVQTCRRVGNDQIALLKCTSAYPASISQANLLTIPHLQNTFGVISGLSDHTVGDTAPVTAAALGARIIEKHFILDKKLGGPDAAFSMDPAEFRKMVKAVRAAEEAMGRVDFPQVGSERKNIIFCRSLFIVEDIQKGQMITPNNLRSIRPGYGLSPAVYHEIIGKKVNRDVKRGTPASWSFISD